MKAMKWFVVAMAVCGGCVEMNDGEVSGSTQQAVGPTTIYHQSWNGGGAYGGAYDPNTGAQGSVWARANGNGPSRTAFMSFNYQGPDPTSQQCFTWDDPWWGSWTYCYFTRFITKWGYGTIPAADFTLEGRAAGARLHTTTGAGFYTETCVYEWMPWGYGNCTYGESATFDLAWKPDGFGSMAHNGTVEQDFGGKGFRQSGSWVSNTARVNGSALGFTISNAYGGIDDTRGATVSNDVVPIMPPPPM